jgi:glycosyltransferase involved in cell wall biosynthesis
LGKASRNRSDYWHRRFSLAPQTRVLLYAGTISQGTAIEKIIGTVPTWPEHWHLVVHSRHDVTKSFAVQILRHFSDSNRVHFSELAMCDQELREAVGAADAGIAFYEPVDGNEILQRNNQVMGLASGKIAYYLQSGLPVVVNNHTTLGRFVENEACGCGVEHERQISEALRTLENDYDRLSDNAVRAFNTHYSYERGFETWFSDIEKATGLHRGQ